jgi:hypothetical protein
MKNIINIGNPAGSVTANSAAFDTWFDDHFFKTSKNSSLSPSGAGPGTTYPYQGISGRTIYAMARYSRPQNCNTINLVTHMNQHRGAVCFERGVANTLQGIYTENVGYADAQDRSQPIGGSATDPYLGAGVRLPYIVQGTTIQTSLSPVEQMDPRTLENWKAIERALREAGKTDSMFYREAVIRLSAGLEHPSQLSLFEDLHQDMKAEKVQATADRREIYERLNDHGNRITVLEYKGPQG